MSGSKTNLMSREQILEAMKTPPPNGYFVWDGIDEDDRPATEEELRAGIALSQRINKTQISLCVDNRVLEEFRAMGKNWQSCMNDALKEWLSEHTT